MSQAARIDPESALKAECREKIMEHGKELMLSGVKLKSSQDRLQMFLWLKKLNEFQANQLSDLKLKLEYLEYLRATLQGKYRVLTKPFNSPPPEILVPFAECIANKTADVIPETPRAGKLQPILCHKSEDDRAFMCIKRTPDNSIFCYMSVAPDAHAFQ